jgi:hypothetical protein
LTSRSQGSRSPGPVPPRPGRAGFTLLNGRYPLSLVEIGWGEGADAWGRGYEYLLIMANDGCTASRIDNPVSKDDVVRFNDGNYFGLAGDF